MLIFIRALAGTVIRLNVSPCESVHMVKTRISQLKGIPVSQQHLIFDGEELANSSSLMGAHISHGALLRLVIGLHSGPISYETVNRQNATQSYNRSSFTHQVIYSLAVPVDPSNRIPASTVVLSLLCPFDGVSRDESQHAAQHLGDSKSHYVSSEASITSCPNQATFYCPSTNEWEDSLSHISPMFPVDEETILGSSEEATTEMAEYMGYAIDEDELHLTHWDVASGTTRKIDATTSGPVSTITNPCTQLENQTNINLNSSVSGCPLVSIYPIHPEVQWIVNHTALGLCEQGESNYPNRSTTNSETHFTPIPVTLGIPVSVPTSTSVRESPHLADKEETRLVLASSHVLDQNGQSSVVSTLPLALPANLPHGQLNDLISDQGRSVATIGSLRSLTNTPNNPGLVIPSFTLLPLSQLNAGVMNASSTSNEQSRDLTSNIITVKNNVMISETPSSTKQFTNLLMHSNPTHILGTKEDNVEKSEEEDPSLQPMNCIVNMRCFTCRRRTRPAQGFSCRCQKWFCQKHHHPEDHNCAFDFKTMRLLSKTNTSPSTYLPQNTDANHSKGDSSSK